jgi:hypothetical protein
MNSVKEGLVLMGLWILALGMILTVLAMMTTG